MSDPFRVRAHVRDDEAYVFDTWRQDFAQDSKLAKFDRGVYFCLMPRHARALTLQRNVQIRIACDAEDEDTIVGFAILSGPTLHYLYTRKTLRGHGIARRLLDGIEVKSYACKTKLGELCLRPAARNWEYAPATYATPDGRVRVEMS